ncbi:LysR family transcriptional regulator [Conexibacter sp. SYSU D00693]|uniref:LysR family transcriptional regulator n=1 Tax=Conexibacter sp. SYSU D00693 TaxID=2812560 RepID=UPI00196BAEFF|nr:LysR family transcriptional regulator [Conexibacter sp. SYSU D00693]
MDLDLHKLRSFVAVAEELHFRRAAERLHLAQPAVSRQVAALERELGVALLERDKRSVTLTPAGEQLLGDARSLLASADGVRRRVQRAGRGRHHLVVGFRAGIVPTATIAAFGAEHPDVQVDVRRMEWDDQEQLILSGRVDIGFVRAPLRREGLRLEPLFSEPRLVALRADHPLADRRRLRHGELADQPHLRYLDPAPVPGLSASTKLRSVEEKLEHVAAGNGIIVLPRSATRYYSRPDVVYVPLTDAEPDHVWLATEAARRSRLLAAFAAAARAALPDDVTPLFDEP